MRGTAIKLALFTIFTASVTFMLASVIGNFSLLSSRYKLEAAFSDVTGLLNGDLVTLAGVEVGKVKAARVEKGVAIVELQIDEAVKIPRDSRIEIKYRNLIGQRVVELQPQSKGAPFFSDGDRVPVDQTKGPLDLDMVFNNLRPLVAGIEGEDVNTLTKTLVESFGRHKEDIDVLLSNTATLTGELAKRDEKIGSLLTNINTTATALSEERNQLARLLTNLADVTGVLASNDGELDRVLTNLNTALGNFSTLIENNRPALDKDLEDLATLLDILVKHQRDLGQIAQGLDDTLRATARATSYGEWANLYIYSLCTEPEPPLPPAPGCAATTSSSSTAFEGSDDAGLRSLLYGATGGSGGSSPQQEMTPARQRLRTPEETGSQP